MSIFQKYVAKARKYTAKAKFPKGYKREHFLADLVNRNGLTRVAELGVWKGRTFLYLLAHCPLAHVVGVDAWKTRPENTEVPGGETYSDWDMANLEQHVRSQSEAYGERVRIPKMETSEAAGLVADGSLDLVFIDADHSESGVLRDIAAWTPKVKIGGYVTGHDIDWPTVHNIVKRRFPSYQTGPDNVWWARREY